MGERVCCAVGFMSPAECVRRIQAATPGEAEKMLCTLEAHAYATRDAEWRTAVRSMRCGVPLSGYHHCADCAPLRALMEPQP